MQMKATQATQTPSGEKKTGTTTIPLKAQFEQLQSSEQGLTGEEARKRLDKYGERYDWHEARIRPCAVFAPVLEPIDHSSAARQPRLGNTGRSGRRRYHFCNRTA